MFFRMLIMIVLLIPSSVSAQSVAPGKLSCSPSRLTNDSNFIVTMPQDHGAELAIVDPSDNYFFVFFVQPNADSETFPYVNATELVNLTQWEAIVNSIMGTTSQTQKNVFSEAGVYTVFIGSQLETDAPEIDGLCYVHFAGSSNK